MNKFCKVIFDQYNQKVIVDFLHDENGMLTANTYFDPEIEDKSTPMGPAALLCKIFLDAIDSANNTDKEQPDAKEPTAESES